MSDLIKEEYNTLRAEIFENRKFVFERPIAIITTLLLSTIFIKEISILAILIPIFAIVLLGLNLSFTVNRIASNARIVAYIELVLEKSNRKNNNLIWIGWESALAKYRQLSLDKKIVINSSSESMKWYDKVLWFHLIPAFLFAVSEIMLLFCSEFNTNDSCLKINPFIYMVFIIIVLIIFYIITYIKYRPSKVYKYLPKAKLIWKQVFQIADELPSKNN